MRVGYLCVKSKRFVFYMGPTLHSRSVAASVHLPASSKPQLFQTPLYPRSTSWTGRRPATHSFKLAHGETPRSLHSAGESAFRRSAFRTGSVYARDPLATYIAPCSPRTPASEVGVFSNTCSAVTYAPYHGFNTFAGNVAETHRNAALFRVQSTTSVNTSAFNRSGRL